LPLIDHPFAGIRVGVALALSAHENKAAIDGLIRLSADPDEEVRTDATFGLCRIDADSAPILAAFHTRLADSSAEIVDYALSALVERNDRTVLPFVSRGLTGPEPDQFLLAARFLADPSLRPALEQAWKTISSETGDMAHLVPYWESSWRDAMAACGFPCAPDS